MGPFDPVIIGYRTPAARSTFRYRDGGRSTRYDRICRTWDVCWS